jgi:kinesin family protein 2/24
VSVGRTHAAAITSVDEERRVVSVEWFENGETKGKEIDLEQVYELNKRIFVPKSTKSSRKTLATPKEKVPGSQLKAVENVPKQPSKGLVPQSSRIQPPNQPTSYRLRSRQPNSSVDQQPPAPQLSSQPLVKKHLPQQSSQAAAPPPSGKKQIPLSQSVASVAPVSHLPPPPPPASSDRDNEPPNSAPNNNKPNAGRKSTCVREVERLKKNREERRARLADKMAQRKEDYDTSHPQWEFLQMIREYCGHLDLRPLVGNEPVMVHRICVCVRKRPLNKKELGKKEVDVTTLPDMSTVLVHEPKTKVDLTKYLENQHFHFDYSFDQSVQNDTVYRFTAQPLVHTIFQQGMATCFAYGQTGSGKTHTMGGSFVGKEQDATKGVYAQAAADVFKLLEQPEHSKKELEVYASYFEIYLGKVFDLLNKKSRLRILENAQHEVQIVGLKEEPVYDLSDVLRLISLGNSCRTSGTTSANQHSSRSHAVFQIILRKRQSGKMYGKLSLIDLAGNERGADTANSDRNTRMEGAEINRSLLALKECIRALGRKGAHLPFRGSKLTQVLKDSFVGENTRTCMIAMISPGLSSCEHTLNTLRYADRVKELQSGKGGRGGGQEVVMAELPPVDALPAAQDDSDELEYTENEDELDRSKEMITFQQACSNIVESEEQLMEDLYTLIQEDRQLLEEQEAVLEAVNVVDHDIDDCVQTLERIYGQKLDRLTKFGGKDQYNNCCATVVSHCSQFKSDLPLS